MSRNPDDGHNDKLIEVADASSELLALRTAPTASKLESRRDSATGYPLSRPVGYSTGWLSNHKRENERLQMREKLILTERGPSRHGIKRYSPREIQLHVYGRSNATFLAVARAQIPRHDHVNRDQVRVRGAAVADTIGSRGTKKDGVTK